MSAASLPSHNRRSARSKAWLDTRTQRKRAGTSSPPPALLLRVGKERSVTARPSARRYVTRSVANTVSPSPVPPPPLTRKRTGHGGRIIRSTTRWASERVRRRRASRRDRTRERARHLLGRGTHARRRAGSRRGVGAGGSPHRRSPRDSKPEHGVRLAVHAWRQIRGRTGARCCFAG